MITNTTLVLQPSLRQKWGVILFRLWGRGAKARKPGSSVFPTANDLVPKLMPSTTLGELGLSTRSLERFLNLYCLETNVMEGTVEFDSDVSPPFVHLLWSRKTFSSQQATMRLIELGFYNQVVPVATPWVVQCAIVLTCCLSFVVPTGSLPGSGSFSLTFQSCILI